MTLKRVVGSGRAAAAAASLGDDGRVRLRGGGGSCSRFQNYQGVLDFEPVAGVLAVLQAERGGGREFWGLACRC